MNKKMKDIIIIGAGGLGKEIYSYIVDDIKKGFVNDNIKGFLDDNADNFNQLGLDKKLYLGMINKYKFNINDYVIVAIGNIKIRNKIIEYLESKNVNFYTYIHNSVFVAYDAFVDIGTVICPNCIIQSNSKIGKHCIINIFCSIGHDSTVKDYCIFSPYTTLNGNVSIGNNVFMGTRVTVLLGSIIGNNCIVSANTSVKGIIKDNFMVKDKVSQIQVKNRLI